MRSATYYGETQKRFVESVLGANILRKKLIMRKKIAYIIISFFVLAIIASCSNNKQDEAAFEDKQDEVAFEDKQDEAVVEDKQYEAAFEDEQDEVAFEDKQDEAVFEDKQEEVAFEDEQDEAALIEVDDIIIMNGKSFLSRNYPGLSEYSDDVFVERIPEAVKTDEGIILNTIRYLVKVIIDSTEYEYEFRFMNRIMGIIDIDSNFINIEDADANYSIQITDAKDKISNYVRESSIIKNKEQVLVELNNIPVKIADFINPNMVNPALFDSGNNVIWINREYENLLDEYMVLHEYFHALQKITLSDAQHYMDSEYLGTKFDEAMADTFAWQISWRTSSGQMPSYSAYMQYAESFIGVWGLEALAAYFYGYSGITEVIPKEELSLFVDIIHNMEEAEADEVLLEKFITVYISLLAKWRNIALSRE